MYERSPDDAYNSIRRRGHYEALQLRQQRRTNAHAASISAKGMLLVREPRHLCQRLGMRDRPRGAVGVRGNLGITLVYCAQVVRLSTF